MPLSGSGPSAASDCSLRGPAVFTLGPELDASLIWGHGRFFFYFYLPFEAFWIISITYVEACVTFINQKFLSLCHIRLQGTTYRVFFYFHSICKISIPSQGGTSGAPIIFIGVSCNAWPITLSLLKASRCDWVSHPFLSEPAPSFPSWSFKPFSPSSTATTILMTSLTCDPSVGNYNICQHEKTAHKDGSGTLFWGNSSSPSIKSGFRGVDTELVGSCGWRRGDHFVQ